MCVFYFCLLVIPHCATVFAGIYSFVIAFFSPIYMLYSIISGFHKHCHQLSLVVIYVNQKNGDLSLVTRLLSKNVLLLVVLNLENNRYHSVKALHSAFKTIARAHVTVSIFITLMPWFVLEQKTVSSCATRRIFT